MSVYNTPGEVRFDKPVGEAETIHLQKGAGAGPPMLALCINNYFRLLTANSRESKCLTEGKLITCVIINFVQHVSSSSDIQ